MLIAMTMETWLSISDALNLSIFIIEYKLACFPFEYYLSVY